MVGLPRASSWWDHIRHLWVNRSVGWTQSTAWTTLEPVRENHSVRIRGAGYLLCPYKYLQLLWKTHLISWASVFYKMRFLCLFAEGVLRIKWFPPVAHGSQQPPGPQAGEGAILQWCAMDRMCVSQIHMLTPNPQRDGVRRWGLWEVMRSWRWSSHDGISVLIKIHVSLSLLSTMWGHSKTTPSVDQEVGSSPDTEFDCVFVLNFLPPDCGK